MICNKCGCRAETDTKFCIRCGADLRQEGATAQESTQGHNQVTNQISVPEAKNMFMAFIFGLCGVIFPFVLNVSGEWYISFISLLFKITGFVLSLIALIMVLKAPKPRRGITLAAFVLSIIGLVVCGIAMTVVLNDLVESAIRPTYWY